MVRCKDSRIKLWFVTAPLTSLTSSYPLRFLVSSSVNEGGSPYLTRVIMTSKWANQNKRALNAILAHSTYSRIVSIIITISTEVNIYWASSMYQALIWTFFFQRLVYCGVNAIGKQGKYLILRITSRYCLTSDEVKFMSPQITMPAAPNAALSPMVLIRSC